MSAHAVERLSAFLDGELPDAERREVQAHLDACASCRERLLELGLVDETARGLEVQAPEGYFEALPGRVRQRLRTRRRAALPVWGFAAAAALLIAVLTPLLKREPLAPRSAPAPALQAPATTPAGRIPPTQPPGPVAETKPAPAAPARNESRAAREGTAPETVERPPASREPRDALRDAEKAAEPPPPAAPGFAAPPASASAPTTPAPTSLEEEKPRPLEALDRPTSSAAAPGLAAGGSLGKARRKQEDEQGRADEMKRSTAARPGSRSPRSAEEARALREDWRSRARRHPEGPDGDEARMGIIETGAQAYRLSGDPQDLSTLRRDVEAYLAREDARHPERVREILRSLDESP